MKFPYRVLLENRAIAERMFYPRQTALDDPFFVECPGAILSCHYHRVHSSKFTIVYFHGNGETVSDLIEHLPRIFEILTCDTFLAEYRGYGMSSGNLTLINMLEDVPYLINSIGRPHREIILYGRSSGCVSAIHAASLFPEIHGLILESGVADMKSRINREWLLDSQYIAEKPFNDAIEFYFDHKSKLEGFHGRTLILHCLFDKVVDTENSNLLHQWANHPKFIKLFYTGNHNTFFSYNNKEVLKIISDVMF
jgi:hypothetical protein